MFLHLTCHSLSWWIIAQCSGQHLSRYNLRSVFFLQMGISWNFLVQNLRAKRGMSFPSEPRFEISKWCTGCISTLDWLSCSALPFIALIQNLISFNELGALRSEHFRVSNLERTENHHFNCQNGWEHLLDPPKLYCSSAKTVIQPYMP